MAVRQLVTGVFETSSGVAATQFSGLGYPNSFGGQAGELTNTPSQGGATGAWAAAGTFKNFTVKLYAAISTAATFAYTLRINGVDTALTVSIVGPCASGTSATDATHTVAVSPGDRVTIKRVRTGTQPAALTNAMTMFEFAGTNTGESGYVTELQCPSAGGWAAASEYWTHVGYGKGQGVTHQLQNGPPTADAFETNGNSYVHHEVIVVPGAITRYDLCCYVGGALASMGTTSLVFALVKNDVLQDGSGGTVDTRVTFTGATQASHWSGTLTVARGDRIRMHIAQTGAVSTDVQGFGLGWCLTATTDGSFQGCNPHVAAIDTTTKFSSGLFGLSPTYNASEGADSALPPPVPFAVWVKDIDYVQDPATAVSPASYLDYTFRVNQASAGAALLSIPVLDASVYKYARVWIALSSVAGTVAIASGATFGLEATLGAEPTFANGVLTLGITWMILTARSGSQYVWSDRPLPDPSSYYLGWKEPRVTKWGLIRRALSKFDGQYETTDFTVTLSDTDRLLRQLDDNKQLVNATVAVYMISDADRRALKQPRTIYRGLVRDAKATPTLNYELTVKDPFQETFSNNTEPQQVPERVVSQTDFGNCAATLVASSGEAYVVNGGAASGATVVPLKTGHGLFNAGDKMKFGSDPTVYGVTDVSSVHFMRTDLATPAGGSTTLTSATGGFTPYMVGGALSIVSGTNFTAGSYTIAAYVSPTQVTLSASPTPGGAGSGGVATTPFGVTDGTDAEVAVVISPALGTAAGAGATVTPVAAHAVTPAVSVRVPFVYGNITDRVLSSSGDSGDGQGPMTYVGDKVGADGKTYGEFLWAGHACFLGTNGSPFSMLYFWNESLDDLGNGGGWPAIGNLATEAALGGRIGLPGYGCWSTTLGLGGSTYVDYSGRRYTVLYLRGVFRDWALGIRPAPVNLGGVPFAVNAYGADSVGDGTGTLISRGLQQYKHILQNWMPPQGTSYQGGPWLASPTFADNTSLSMIDENSFDAADLQGRTYASVYFRGDFIVGANNEVITRRDLLARLNQSFGVDCGFNRNIQFYVNMINRDAGQTMQTALTYVRDIFSGTWVITPSTQELYTTIPYRHTQDYLKRETDGWRSVETGVLETENTLATAAYGGKTSSPMYQMFMVRGKNRSSDASDYNDGTATAGAVLALKLARVSSIQHIPAWQTGPAGFNYEMGDVIPVTEYEGLGSGGYTSQPLRVERAETDPSQYVQNIEAYDMGPMIGVTFLSAADSAKVQAGEVAQLPMKQVKGSETVTVKASEVPTLNISTP